MSNKAAIIVHSGDLDKALAIIESIQGYDESIGTRKRPRTADAARASLTLNQLIAENRANGLCVGTCMRWLLGLPRYWATRRAFERVPAPVPKKSSTWKRWWMPI